MEILCGQGRSQEESARQCGIPLNTYCRWRKQFGGMDTSDAKRLKELEKENAKLKRLVADLSLDNAILKDVNLKKLLSPVKRKAAVDFVTTFYSVSNRRSCRVLGINRNAYRYMPRFLPDEDDLRRQIIDLATNHRRWGYRKVCDVINAMRDKSDTYLPRVNHKRIERIWREEGLKAPKKSTRKKSIITDEG